MMDFLAWLEQSGFATWARESNSLFAYPSILCLHTVGMGLVAGISALIDLRILGCAEEIQLSGMQRLVPYMWAGFWLNTGTGIVLFILDATTKAIDLVFYTKMAFIAMAVVLCVIQGRSFRDPLLDKRRSRGTERSSHSHRSSAGRRQSPQDACWHISVPASYPMSVTEGLRTHL